MKVLVTGGAGYIGSQAVRKLLEQGHDVLIVDDLSHGHKQAVTAAGRCAGRRAEFLQFSTDQTKQLVQALVSYGIEVVMHFAAFIEVAESMSNPSKYYRNNVSNTLSLLDAMYEAGVNKLVFSSTAAVYGNPLQTPIAEDHPRQPINPYGRSKMMIEMAIEDYARAYGLGYAILRYFNVCGASPDGVMGEAHEPESHLIPRILMASQGQMETVKIFGTDYPTPDGTCIRDFIHVDDLVEAHILAMKALVPGRGEVYNLGSETGFSVREVIAACSKVVRRPIPAKAYDRRAGDPAVLVASSAKIRRELGWKPRFPSLDTIVHHAWQWHSTHPRGYAAESDDFHWGFVQTSEAQSQNEPRSQENSAG